MKKLLLACTFTIAALCSFCQDIRTKLTKAWQQFEADSQLRTAISSLYVIDGKTGKVVFENNSSVGLPTASTLKIITAATAYEHLGRDYRYETKFGYVGMISDKTLLGNFYVKSFGDPTFGSWRWKATSDTAIGDKITTAIKKLKITGYGGISIGHAYSSSETIPDGWIWQDIGNYYGAGAAGFNWRENQYDIVLKSGSKFGDPVAIVKKRPETSPVNLVSLVTSAAKGTGDNAYVYYPLLKQMGVIRGTIPINENAFTISAAAPFPDIEFSSFFVEGIISKLNIRQINLEIPPPDTTILFTHYSPPLDSIIYWFLKRSINLYGEALMKTFSFRKTGYGSTDDGVDITRKFWKEKGIDPAELNIVDGSGLSPLNRVTTRAQVAILAYAKKQSWFSGFFDGFPTYNAMKMKSGTIRGVKGFCGYHTAKDGNEYIFSFLVNNYNSSASAVVQKTYKVLDVLK